MMVPIRRSLLCPFPGLPGRGGLRRSAASRPASSEPAKPAPAEPPAPASQPPAETPADSRNEEITSESSPKDVDVVDPGGERGPVTLVEAARAERERRARSGPPVAVITDKNVAHSKGISPWPIRRSPR